MSRRASEYKPLLFTTTLRNPERIKDFVKVLSSYNGQRLTNELIMKVVKDMIKNKLYWTMYIKRKPRLKSIFNDEDRQFTDLQIAEIIANSPQNHKEAGFDKGWPSRFDTWYKFLKELGFVYYNMNQPIEISESGLNLSLSDQPDKRHLEQQVFLNAFVKYHRINPFRRIMNNNKPLLLLLNVINKLKEHYGEESAGISIKEIPLIIIWKDEDFDSLVDTIINIRTAYSYTPSDEYMYSICKQILGLTIDDERRFKMSNILKELPDEFIRKMRLTGLISIRGYGRFVDINHNEINKIEYVLTHYQDRVQFDDERAYFNYMRNIDANLVSLESIPVADLTTREMLFMQWVGRIEKDILLQELNIVVTRNLSSRHEVFKFLDGPVRLEFLTALIIKKCFPSIMVNANYNIDDEGLPTSFAQGGEADIICKDNLGNILYEVTLLTGTQQNIREMPAIARHLRSYIEDGKSSYSIMLAPSIHNDTLEYSEFIKTKDNLDIYPISVSHFITKINNDSEFRELHIQ